MFSLITHTHRQGTSSYLVDLPHTPSIEEAEAFIGEDYEPDRDEDINILPLDHVYSQEEFKEGVPNENLKQVYVPIQMDEEHLTMLRKQKQELVDAIDKGHLSSDQEGILALIDHIQDTLADSDYFDEEDVFGKTSEKD